MSDFVIKIPTKCKICEKSLQSFESAFTSLLSKFDIKHIFEEKDIIYSKDIVKKIGSKDIKDIEYIQNLKRKTKFCKRYNYDSRLEYCWSLNLDCNLNYIRLYNETFFINEYALIKQSSFDLNNRILFSDLILLKDKEYLNHFCNLPYDILDDITREKLKAYIESLLVLF